jgi:hypothetical protein
MQTQTEDVGVGTSDDGDEFPTNLDTFKPTKDLESFLEKVAPDVYEQLQQNAESHAFDGI